MPSQTIKQTVLLSLSMLALAVPTSAAPSADHRALEAPGEVIQIEGHVDKQDRSAVPKETSDNRRIPAYSDRAIASDKWTRAWMLLDVDETGAVTRTKFLKQPGMDLEPIAVDTSFTRTFAPARDRDGNRVRAYVVYGIEWPGYWWMIQKYGQAVRMPYAAKLPICAGTGPMNLDSRQPSYRDCSVPDLKVIDFTSGWLTRPTRVAAAR